MQLLIADEKRLNIDSGIFIIVKNKDFYLTLHRKSDSITNLNS